MNVHDTGFGGTKYPMYLIFIIFFLYFSVPFGVRITDQVLTDIILNVILTVILTESERCTTVSTPGHAAHRQIQDQVSGDPRAYRRSRR